MGVAVEAGDKVEFQCPSDIKLNSDADVPRMQLLVAGFQCPSDIKLNSDPINRVALNTKERVSMPIGH